MDGGMGKMRSSTSAHSSSMRTLVPDELEPAKEEGKGHIDEKDKVYASLARGG